MATSAQTGRAVAARTALLLAPALAVAHIVGAFVVYACGVAVGAGRRGLRRAQHDLLAGAGREGDGHHRARWPDHLRDRLPGRERLLRPTFQWALTQGAPRRPGLPGIVARSMLAWALGTGVPVLGVTAIVEAAGEEEAALWVLGEEVTLRGRTAPTRLAIPA
ncbi:MAG TPA: hypothetical protein VGW11_00995 [Solirubrobacteraceae bacterium]|nr:hypothetical protein [Solirubrobacteraceae bacterium]